VITALPFKVQMPSRHIPGKDQAAGTSGLTITFARKFHTLQAVNITITSGHVTGDHWSFASRTRPAFTSISSTPPAPGGARLRL